MGEPRLVVLGTAQDGGHPQAGCVRACCTGGGAHRVVCLGIIDGDQRFLVDCTPDFPSQLRDVGGPPLAGILLTHAHSGHYTGLLHLGPEAWAPRDVPVWAMPGMAAFLRGNAPWSGLETDGNVVLRPLAADRPVVLTPTVTVTPWLVPHRGPWTETVGFSIRGPRHHVVYVPDIDRWDDWDRDPADVIRGADRVYVDGTFHTAGETPGRDPAEIRHPLVTDTVARWVDLPLAERNKVTFLHLNHTNPLLDPQSVAHREVTALGFRVATDGETFAL